MRKSRTPSAQSKCMVCRRSAGKASSRKRYLSQLTASYRTFPANSRVLVSGMARGVQSFILNCFAGYKPPVGFTSESKSERSLPISVPVGLDEGEWPVLVTTGKSCYNPGVGLRIHIEDSFATFLSRLQISIKCAESQLFINNGNLKIGFHRTLRVSENGRVHQLPASLGFFPSRILRHPRRGYGH